jgi:GH25 family lysozyme M1 (1,4-beta-N-acetylmuramidase)
LNFVATAEPVTNNAGVQLIDTLERRILFADTRPYGIDTSHWDGTITWTQVHAAGKVFAWQKATEGVTYDDPTLGTNMGGAKNAGVLIGAYHFARPENNSAADEVTHFVASAKQYMTFGYLRPALDLEAGADVYTTPAFSQWVNDFMTGVRSATGVTPVIYIGRYARQGEVDSSVTVWPMWVAHWTEDPVNTSPSIGIWPSYAFWQYSATGAVPGISGDVDLDVYNGDMASLQANYAIPRTGALSSAFNFNLPPGTGQTLTVQFNLNVGASLTKSDLTLLNTTTGQTIPSANIQLSGYNPATNLATFTFPGYTNGVLPSGNYTATFSAAGITDLAGTTMAANYQASFFFLQGDLNHDHNVDTQDFNTLAANFNASGRSFSQGNLNYDTNGMVDSIDFNLLAANFGKTQPGDTASAPAGAGSGANQPAPHQPTSLFGAAPICGTDDVLNILDVSTDGAV